MKVYVELTYTIAVEADHAAYDVTTDDELLEALRSTSGFAVDYLHNGPHVVHDVDWRIPDLWGHTRQSYDAAGGMGFQVVTEAVAQR